MVDSIQDSMKSTSSDDYFLQKRMEIIIESNNKKVLSELANINNAIGKINADLCEIKKSFRDNGCSQAIASKRVITESVAVQGDAKGDIEDHSQFDIKRTKVQPPSKPRYGDYTPEDVAIDKFFYFGGKKN